MSAEAPDAPDPSERLRRIQEHVRSGRYLATEYAERKWIDECKCSWSEMEELVARLKPEHCRGSHPSVNPDYPHDIVDQYRMKIGLKKKNRERACWFEFVLMDDYVKVVSAHRTTLKKRES